MQKRTFKKALSLTLCMMLIAVMALFTSGCGDKKNQTDTERPMTQESEQNDWNVLGEGKNQFKFTVTDADGTESFFEIHTDKTIVGEALLELELISGEEGAYGLYVKTVNGITADYDADGTYWAFYINDQYALSGVETASIKAGETYSFRVSK